MPQAKPKKVAQPRPLAAAPPVVKSTRFYSTKNQDAFVAEADALAESLGWSGPADNELNDIRVEDAQNYLRRVFHELHQDACHPSELTGKPTKEQLEAELAADRERHASAICDHLTIVDSDEVMLVAAAVKAAYDRECAQAPANPTATGSDSRVASMSANLTGDVSALIGKGK